MNSRPHEELAQIARDLVHGKIFTDRHIDPGDKISMVFMILGLLDGEQMKKLQDDPPGLVFEYLDKAGEMSVNGYPMFLSMQMLSPADTETVFDLARKLEAAEREVLGVKPT
jgi:hypothetical protein